jgi:hypothetical protein
MHQFQERKNAARAGRTRGRTRGHSSPARSSEGVSIYSALGRAAGVVAVPRPRWQQLLPRKVRMVAWCTSPSTSAAATIASPRISPQASNPRLLVMTIDPRS